MTCRVRDDGARKINSLFDWDTAVSSFTSIGGEINRDLARLVPADVAQRWNACHPSFVVVHENVWRFHLAPLWFSMSAAAFGLRCTIAELEPSKSIGGSGQRIVESGFDGLPARDVSDAFIRSDWQLDLLATKKYRRGGNVDAGPRRGKLDLIPILSADTLRELCRRSAGIIHFRPSERIKYSTNRHNSSGQRVTNPWKTLRNSVGELLFNYFPFLGGSRGMY